MGLSCSMKCLKFILFAFNFLFWILGIVVLAVGIYVRYYNEVVRQADPGSITIAGNILIASGSIVMVIGFLGCCGAIKENKCLLTLYVIFVFLIFVMEIAGGILVYVKKPKQDAIEGRVKDLVQRLYGGSGKDSEAFTKAVDDIQKKFKCCGVSGYQDWNGSVWYNSSTKAVPDSCCDGSSCANSKPTPTGIYTQGCSSTLQQLVTKGVVVVAGVGIGIALVQILGIVFGICLCRALTYEKV